MAAANSHNVCQHNKYGFCKYQLTCRMKHVNEICEKSNCEIHKCTQRHPIRCKYYQDYQRCKFGSYCYYRHEETPLTAQKTWLPKYVLHTFTAFLV